VANYRDRGVVLRTIRLGEADRIATILSLEHGKVRAVAKGVRKVKSRLGARTEPLTHVDFLAWRGRELDVVNQVEVIDVFPLIRGDLARFDAAVTMAEIIDQSTVDHQQSPDLYRLLVGALRSLEETGSLLVLAAFCLKLLAIEGVGVVADRCAACGSDAPLVAFDAAQGGFLCGRCRRGQAVSAEVVGLARTITCGGLAGALRDTQGPEVGQLEQLAVGAVEHHLERRLRSARHHLAEANRSA
jgi:DNA repair protein RecO (recombination protein O)